MTDDRGSADLAREAHWLNCAATERDVLFWLHKSLAGSLIANAPAPIARYRADWQVVASQLRAFTAFLRAASIAHIAALGSRRRRML